MKLCRLLTLALVLLLATWQRRPKCPHCAQRAGREWRGMAGYCKACGFMFRV